MVSRSTCGDHYMAGIARLAGATQYGRASMMDREALEYWAIRFSRMVTARYGAAQCARSSLRGALATKQSSGRCAKTTTGLLRGACHRAALCADPLVRNAVQRPRF